MKEESEKNAAVLGYNYPESTWYKLIYDDLTNQNDVKRWINKKKPEIVINAAGRVGGILDNSNYKSDYIFWTRKCW